MTAPVSNGNGNIRNFDETLERCLQAIERGQATVESCVTRFPEYQELGETLRMAIAVRGMPRPQMPAAAATKTRQRLQSHLRAQVRARDSQVRRRSRLLSLPLVRFVLAVGLVALVLFAGGAGLARASESALPGQPLYPVKRVIERGELLFASNQARPGVLYHIAEKRIGEVAALGAHGQAIPDDVLSDLADSVNYAILEQPDAAQRAQLVDEAAHALRQAQASGSVSAEVADNTLSKLVLRPTQAATVVQPQGDTPTPGAVAQASTTLTRTPLPTATLTLTGTPTQTPSPTPTLTPTRTLPPTQTLVSPSPTNSPTNTVVPTATATATAMVTAGLPPLATLIPTTSVARVFTNVPTVTATATALTATPSEAAATETSVTGTAATGEPGSPTVLPDDTPTQLMPETTETPETQATVTATETETIAPSSTPTATRTPVPSKTPKPTLTPSLTPSATATATLTQTPMPTATAEDNGLPPTSFKQPPQVGTYNNCPPEGQGGDPAYNRFGNRTDDGNYQPVALDTLIGLSWPKEVEHKPRDQWPPDAQDRIARADGLPLVVEGYVAQAQQKGPEPQNCQSSTDLNVQVWLVARSESKGDLAKALVVQITPRVRTNHPGWTVDQLNALAAAGLRVRISGWLLLDADHPEDVGKSRDTLWELHPVMQIAVSKDGQWVNLDDYQP